jgi:ferritin-like metal-binding protein YciE
MSLDLRQCRRPAGSMRADTRGRYDLIDSSATDLPPPEQRIAHAIVPRASMFAQNSAPGQEPTLLADIEGTISQIKGSKNMPDTVRDIFVTGLRNAHAMETQARELMERQSERLDEYPEMKARISEHLRETNQQLQRLERCLEACGESTSTLKDTAQSMMANMMAMAHSMAGDEILKNTFANNAFENYEIAAYKSLIALTGSAGVESTRALLQQSLQEEERMAQWVANNVEKITLDYVNREQRRAA